LTGPENGDEARQREVPVPVPYLFRSCSAPSYAEMPMAAGTFEVMLLGDELCPQIHFSILFSFFHTIFFHERYFLKFVLISSMYEVF
jgi:hypothetical protein